MQLLYKAKIKYRGECNQWYVDFTEYTVIRETKHTYFIEFKGKEKRVLKKSDNGFAFDSKHKALVNLKHRRIRHQRLLESAKYINAEIIKNLENGILEENTPYY